jgi:energy-coupling factor transporter ATP-binding protein EcfA2
VQVNSLSGGERRRLQLAAVLVEKPNLLILDEPTNDLDLQTVEVVEELLSDYKGCLLVVSHDRAFMENLADRLFVVSGDGLVRLYDGLYSEVSHCHARTFTLSCTPVCFLSGCDHFCITKLPFWCNPVLTSLVQQYLAVDAEPSKRPLQHIQSCVTTFLTARHDGGAMYT